MGIATWKREYYKGRLRDAARDPLSAVEHSIKKWKGLRSKNLKAHGLVPSWGDIVDQATNKVFTIDVTTCALCKMCGTGSDDQTLCIKCPIVKVTGRTCDGRDGSSSAYGDWTRDDDPEPMIKLLKHVRREIKKGALCS